jgi:hypothetical protein
VFRPKSDHLELRFSHAPEDRLVGGRQRIMKQLNHALFQQLREPALELLAADRVLAPQNGKPFGREGWQRLEGDGAIPWPS